MSELRLVDDIPSFQDFFPTVSLEDLLGAQQAMTDQDKTTQTRIETRAEQMANTFDGAENAPNQEEIEIPCPHCGESSFISRTDLQSKLGFVEYQ